MTTVINNPSNGEGSGSGVGMVLGIIILIVVVVLFFVYVLPGIRNSGTPQDAPKNDTLDVNVTIPTNGGADAENTNN